MSALRYVTTCCRGWTAIVNDDLIWRALLCGAIVVMAIAVVLGLGCAWLLHAFGFVRDELINESLQMGCALGLLVGGIAASLLSTMLDSSVAMVFVSFAENPSALQVHDMTSLLLSTAPPPC
jgi:ABC-type sulfate transport system permease component